LQTNACDNKSAQNIKTATVQYLIDGIPPATAAAALLMRRPVHKIETAIVRKCTK
jgi:hypothetical protein